MFYDSTYKEIPEFEKFYRNIKFVVLPGKWQKDRLRQTAQRHVVYL